MTDGKVGRDGCLVFKKKGYVRSSCGSKMWIPEAEGGQDEDDILGFPGDGFLDPEVGDPLDTMQEDLDSGVAEMTGVSRWFSRKQCQETQEECSCSSRRGRRGSYQANEDKDYGFEDCGQHTVDADIEGQLGPGHSKREARR
jgi:hypothetical protein